MLPKNIWGENSHLFAYLHFCAFAWVSLCLLMLLVLLVRAKTYCKKKNKKKNNNNNIKKFKTGLITSFILLLIFLL